MAYNEAPQYPGYLGGPPFISQPLNNEGPLFNSDRGQQRDEPPAATSYLHGEALARDLWAERYGPWKTVYDRFNRYRREGFIDKLLERLQVRIDEKGLIDWDLFCVDGSNVRASRAAAGAGQKAPPASLRTTRWAARAAAGAASSTWLLTVRELRWPCT